jgi:hypothetical protein
MQERAELKRSMGKTSPNVKHGRTVNFLKGKRWGGSEFSGGGNWREEIFEEGRWKRKRCGKGKGLMGVREIRGRGG